MGAKAVSVGAQSINSQSDVGFSREKEEENIQFKLTSNEVTQKAEVTEENKFLINDGVKSFNLFGQEVIVTVSGGQAKLKLNLTNPITGEDNITASGTIVNPSVDEAGFKFVSAHLATSDIVLPGGLKFTALEVNATPETYDGKGTFAAAGDKIKSAKGDVGITNDGNKTNYTLSNGELGIELFGQTIEVKGVTYKDGKIEADAAKLKLNLTNPITGEDNITASGTIVNPSVDEAGFKFVSAHLATSDIVLPGGLKFTALEVNATPETYDGKGTFAAAGDKIKSAKGDVGITNDGNKTNYTLSNGELGIELFGQTIEVKGVTYKDGKIEADAAKLKLNLTNPITGEDNITASGTIVNPSVDEAGFKFVSAHLATSDIVLPGGLKFTALEVNATPETYDGKGTFAAAGDKIKSAKGDVGITNDGNKTNYTLSNGELGIELFGQTIEVKGVTYKDGKIEADAAKLKLNLTNPITGEDNITASGTIVNPSVDEAGFKFVSAHLATSDIVLPGGLKFTALEVNATPETYDGKGTFAAAGDKIKSAKGDVGITNDGNKTNYTLSNGELGIELFGQTIEVKGVTYKDGKIEADAAKLKLNLTNPITGEDNITASGTIVNPSVDEAGFKFVSAHLATSDIVLPGGLKFTALEVNATPETYDGKGTFAAAGDKIKSAKGDVGITNDGNKTNYTLSNGELGIELFGQTIEVKGVTYKDGKIEADAAKLKLNLTNPITGEDNITASGTIVNPSVDEAGFKFVSAHLATSDIVLPGGLKFTALEVNATPETYDGKGTFAAAGDKIKSAKGDVGITNDGNKTNYTLSNGELGIELFGQTIEVKGVTYKDGKIEADAAKLKLNLTNPITGEDNITASGTIVNPSVDEAGFKFVSAHLATSDIVLPGGLKFTALEVNATPETYDGKGTFAAAGDKIKSAKGDVGITNDGNKTNYTLSNGELGIELFGQTIEVKGVTYKDGKIEADAAKLKLNLTNPITGEDNITASGTIVNPSVDEAGFKFVSAHLATSDIVLPGGLKFTALEVNATPETYDGKGTFAAAGDKIKSAKGDVGITNDGNKTNYTLSNGELGIELFGQTIEVKGVTYKDGKIEADAAKLKLNLTNPITGEDNITASGTIVNPSVDEAGFKFVSAHLATSDIVLPGGLKFTALEVNATPETYDGKGTFAAAGDKIKSAKGDVGITNDGNKTNYTLSNGELGIELFGQTIEVKGVTFDSKSLIVGDANVQISVPIPGMESLPKVSVQGLKIDKNNNWDFESISIKKGIDLDFLGFLKVGVQEMTVKKDAQGMQLSAMGGISGNLNVFGKEIGSFGGSGTLMHDFETEKTNKTLEGVSATLPKTSFPKDLIGIDGIGGNATIPVFPGVSIVAGASLSGGVNIPPLQLNFSQLSEDNYKISFGTIETPAAGFIQASLFVGAQLGYSALLSSDVTLNADGKIAALLAFDASKEISMGEKATKLELGNDESMRFNYELSGEAKLAAILKIRAKVLYFFTKEYNKTLAEKSLGKFKIFKREYRMGKKYRTFRKHRDRKIYWK